MEKSILDVLTEYMMNERLDGMLQDNEEYIRTQKNIDLAMEEYMQLDLIEGQFKAMDKLISAYNASGAFYARMSYQQGVKDCASLLVEMGLIKDGNREKSE